MKHFTKKIAFVFTLCFILLSISETKAQELSLGADLYNRYVWRGLELGGNTPSFQPTISLSTGGFTAGFWGAYSMSDPAGLNEIDIYASYAFELPEAGSLSLGVTDYTNPNSGTKMGNFNNYDDPEGPGAHFVELNVGYTGPESFPISLSLNYFLYNVENSPFYFQVGYDTSIKDVGLSVFVGGTPGEDAGYYGVTDFSLINVGFKATKEIKITDSFSIPMSGSIILNPSSEDLFYVVGISL
jgi:hypothetical protein